MLSWKSSVGDMYEESSSLIIAFCHWFGIQQIN